LQNLDTSGDDFVTDAVAGNGSDSVGVHYIRSYLAALAGAAILVSACGGSDDTDTPTPPAVALAVERVFPALSFALPVALLQAPGDSTRWFVVEQGGRVRVFANSPQVFTFFTFADISHLVSASGEMGLLGMAFHPNFPTNPRVYLSYTNEDAGRVNRVSEFRLNVAGNVDTTPGMERVILSVPQPAANHNGGQIAFGPDGFLYVGRGDGGGANDQLHGPIGNGQSLTTLLGKILRIDVNSVVPYGIPSGPAGNPFAGNQRCLNGISALGQNCPEIYAWGFRNPWRWSFDRGTDTLWVGDVGQNAIEEVDRVDRGGNYGWRCFEGTRATGLPCGPAQDLLPPVAEYPRAEGTAVTGGYVYRGSAIPGLAGRYVFGDFGSGKVWHIAADTPPTMVMTGGLASGLNISSFAEDLAGELYVVDYSGGIYRLIRK
jgi:glucose/arabinose dehydrogenase